MSSERGYEAHMYVNFVNRTASCVLKTNCRLGERGCSSNIIGSVRKYNGHIREGVMRQISDLQCQILWIDSMHGYMVSW